MKKLITQVLKRYSKSERDIVISAPQEITNLPTKGYLILNYDDESIRKLKEKTSLEVLTYGFQEEVDFRASDLKINGGLNFKINYKGNVVPVWLEGKDNDEVYAALAATNTGVIFDLNLVEISQALTPIIK